MGRKHCEKRRKRWSAAFSPFPTMFSKRLFVKPAYGDRDIVVTVTVWCKCVVSTYVHLSELVQVMTSAVVDEFQNDLTPLLSITCRYAI